MFNATQVGNRVNAYVPDYYKYNVSARSVRLPSDDMVPRHDDEIFKDV